MPQPLASLDDKLTAIRKRLASLDSALVAFSGGVDSAVVLALAVDALGRERVTALTARSPSVPQRELADAARVAREIGAAHEFVDTAEFDDPNYTANPNNRCYYCKSELYGRLTRLASGRGVGAVLSGTNADDLGDYRPGLQAAAEHRVLAPLADAGVTKADVRMIAARFGISIRDKPASPCLSSRVPYGEAVTPEKLTRIDAAETLLRSLGFSDCRVRSHEGLARIEAPLGELARLHASPVREQVVAGLLGLGFAHVTVDLRGLRSGSLNELLLGPGMR